MNILKSDRVHPPLSGYIDIVLLAILLAGALVFRYVPGAGEFYARALYPVISAVLSAVASVFPFSLDEWAVVLMAAWLVLWPVMARKRGKRWKRILLRELEWVLWIYVWFYWGWGMNYYRDSVYERAGVRPAAYEKDVFRDFLYTYSDSLNSAFRMACESGGGTFTESASSAVDIHVGQIQEEIKGIYRRVPENYGLSRPYGYQRPKFTCFNFLYSGVGVLGYMGPFFAESHLNRELPEMQYPFTYAHELSHLLGISSEAEANFWAFNVCIRSSRPEVRYSGYAGILPYVISNARTLLEKQEYQDWLSSVNPAVIDLLRSEQEYWRSRYSPAVGRIQDALYTFYLKGNRITSGQKNYAEVVSVLLSLSPDF